jgi:hypothetical protein
MVQDALTDVRIVVGPILIELERHQHTDAIARRVVKREPVELALEPAFNRVDAQRVHRAEIALVESFSIARAQAGVLRVVADAANDTRLPVDQVTPRPVGILLEPHAYRPGRVWLWQQPRRIRKLLRPAG